MTTRRILIWNIEQFGAWKKPAAGTLFSRARLNQIQFPFVRHLAEALNIDVIVIQEFRRNGSAFLFDLQTQLNDIGPADWHFDYIPGAVTTAAGPGVGGAAAPGPPVTGADLGYPTAANNEGYAVLYRAGTLSAFAQPPPKLSTGEDGAADAPGYLRLVLEQRPRDFDPDQDPPVTIGSQPPPWVDAEFPRSSQAALRRPLALKRRTIVPEDYACQWNDARRPCVVVLADSGAAPGGGHGPATLMVYHAPVNSPSNYRGALLAGLARDTRDAANGGARVVVGGDFNLTSNTHLTHGFARFTDNAIALATTGAGPAAWGVQSILDHGPNVPQFQRSSVHYDATNANQTLRSARDQVVIGNDTHLNGSGYVVDILGALTTAGHPLATSVFADAGMGAEVGAAVALGEDTHGGFGPWGLDDDVFDIVNIDTDLPAPWGAGVANPVFNDRITAAVFYKQFISDHLPLYAEVDV